MIKTWINFNPGLPCWPSSSKQARAAFYIILLLLDMIASYDMTSSNKWVNPVVVPFDFEDESLVCDYSNENYAWAVLSSGVVCFWQFFNMIFKIFSSVLNLHVALLGVKGLTVTLEKLYCCTCTCCLSLVEGLPSAVLLVGSLLFLLVIFLFRAVISGWVLSTTLVQFCSASSDLSHAK